MFIYYSLMEQRYLFLMITYYYQMIFLFWGEYILYFQSFILPCRCNFQTVSPFIRFLSGLSHKRNVIHAYMISCPPHTRKLHSRLFNFCDLLLTL